MIEGRLLSKVYDASLVSPQLLFLAADFDLAEMAQCIYEAYAAGMLHTSYCIKSFDGPSRCRAAIRMVTTRIALLPS